MRREAPAKARARVAHLREALVNAKAEVLDDIRELQGAQSDLKKAEYNREAKVRHPQHHMYSCTTWAS